MDTGPKGGAWQPRKKRKEHKPRWPRVIASREIGGFLKYTLLGSRKEFKESGKVSRFMHNRGRRRRIATAGYSQSELDQVDSNITL